MAQEVQNRPVKDKLLQQVQALNEADQKKVLKVRARHTKVRSEFVGHTFAVFNGEDYVNVRVEQDMVGRTFGKVVPRFAPTARSMYLSIPHRKMRRVAELVLGLPVEKALGVLNFTPKIAAEHMARTLKAAVANKLSSEGTAHLAPEDLFVSRIVVDEGPTAKRVRFQSMGRVFRVRKRFCHLAIYLDQRAGTEVVLPKAVTGKAEDAKSAAKPARKPAPREKTASGKKAAAPKKTAAKKKTASKKTAKAVAGKDAK